MAHRNPSPPDSPDPVRNPATSMRTHANVTGADLQKVTDVSTEKESHNLGKAATLLQNMAVKGRTTQTDTNKEKIVVNRGDVECVMSHMEVTRVVAERTLREHKGDLYDALVALINS